MVLIQSGVSAEAFCDDLEDELNVEFRAEQRLSQSINLWLLAFDPSKIETNKALLQIERNEATIIAQLNHTNLIQRGLPNDSLFYKQWAFDNNGTNGGSGMADIQADEAWEITTGGLTVAGDTIVVAIIDGGFDINHEDLKANLFINHLEIPANGIDDDQNGYVDDVQGWDSYSNDYTLPVDNHGTHVAGTVGAVGNNEIGVTGINWNVKILPVAGSSSLESTVVAAYGYVLDMRKTYNQSGGTKGAYIVSTNSSFGVDYGQPAEYPIWCAMYDSLGYEGILSAAATANLPIDVDQLGDVPTACSSDFLISVTNTTSSDTRNSGAAFGISTIDIGAPGSTIYSLYNYNNYGLNTGTSMATPHVAGTIGLMYSAACNKYFDTELYTHSERALAFKNELLTHGVDSLLSLNNQVLSHGRLNLYKAVLSVTDSCLALTGNTELATCDSCNGAIYLKVFGDPFGSQYVWSNGAVGDSITGLCAGLYTVTASDQLGDTVILNFSISNLGGPVISSNLAQISCFGEQDGSITVSGASSYVWNDQMLDSIRLNLQAGLYTVTATDSAGCASIQQYEIIEPSLLEVTFANVAPNPSNDTNGIISISGIGGTQPYFISWADGSTEFYRDSLAVGWYFYTLTDANGCSLSDSLHLGTPAGVSETKLPFRLSVYPNPTSGLVHFECTDLIQEIKIFDQSGRIVAVEALSNFKSEVDLGRLSSGLYFTSVNINGEVRWFRIVKE